MRIGYCVSGGGRVIEAILEARKSGLIQADAVAIVDRPTAFTQIAESHGLPVEMVNCREFPDKEQFRKALADRLLGLPLDALFLTFDWILPPSVVARYSPNMVNLHMALLPLFKGRGAISAAASSGMAIAGVTYHRVDEGMDTGPTIAQAVAPIVGMTEQQVGAALFRRAVPLGIQCARWLETGSLGGVVNGRVEVAGAGLDDGPFSPALDPDIAEFATAFLNRRYPIAGAHGHEANSASYSPSQPQLP